MFGRKRLEEKITATVRAEFAGIITSLEKEHREYLRRSKIKEKTRSAFERAESEAQRLHSERVALKKRFWEAYYQKDETVLSKIESKSRRLDRAAKRAEKTLKKARANFERADFDEVAEGYALKAKASTAEDEVNSRIETLEKGLEDLLAGVRRDAREAVERYETDTKSLTSRTPEDETPT